MPYLATYAGYVEDVDDPEQLGRLKVRVPVVYGPADAQKNTIATADIPWALPAGLPAGGSGDSGAIQWLPQVGDHVFVRFLDGEPEKPIWEWGGQDRAQAKSFSYWRRQPGGYDPAGSAPKSSLLTRFGHSVEFSPDSLIISTSHGYALVLNDAGDEGFGLVQLLSAKGYQVSIDDNKDRMSIFVPNLIGLIQVITLVGTDYTLKPSNSLTVTTTKVIANSDTTNVNATISAAVTSPRVALGSSPDANDPVVRLSDLQAVVTAIVAQFNRHTHPKTPPPTTPMVVEPTGSETTFST